MTIKSNNRKSTSKRSSSKRRLVEIGSTPAMKAKEMSEDDRLNDHHFEPFYYGGVLRCGAKSKRHGRKCYAFAMENGRCPVHGGKSTGPIGIKGTSVVTGEFESLMLSSLNDEELYLYFGVNPDPVAMVDHELRLITVRERRMLERIAGLSESEFSIVQIQSTSGITADKFTETKTKIKESNIERIQRIEEALTRVQDKKSRLIELKHKFQSKDGKDAGLLDELADVIRQSAELLKQPMEDEPT